jgi:hypothetical protein
VESVSTKIKDIEELFIKLLTHVATEIDDPYLVTEFHRGCWCAYMFSFPESLDKEWHIEEALTMSETIVKLIPKAFSKHPELAKKFTDTYEKLSKKLNE